MAKDNPPTKEEQQKAREVAKKILMSHGLSEQEIETYLNANNATTDPAVLATIAKQLVENRKYDPNIVKAVSEIKNYADNMRYATDPKKKAEWEGYYRDAIQNAPAEVGDYIKARGYAYDPNDPSTNWVRDYQGRTTPQATPQAPATPTPVQATTPAPQPAPKPTPAPQVPVATPKPTAPTTTTQAAPAQKPATQTAPQTPVQTPKPTQPTTPSPAPTQTTTQVATPTPKPATTTTQATPQTPTPQQTQQTQPTMSNRDKALNYHQQSHQQLMAEQQTPINKAYAMPSSTKRTPNTTAPAPTPVATETPKYTNLEEIYNDIYKDHEEQTGQLKRSERTKGVISAIGDAGSAIANLIAANNYAPNMLPAGTPTLSGKAKERYERLKKEVDANRDARLKRVIDLQNQRYKDATAKYQEDSIAIRKLEQQRLREQLVMQQGKQAWTEYYQQQKLDLEKDKVQIEKDYKEGLLTEQQKRTAIQSLEAQTRQLEANNRYMNKTTNVEIKRDSEGHEVGRTTTTTYEGGQGGGSASSNKGGSNNKPKSNNTNTNTNDKGEIVTGVNWQRKK